MIRRFQILVYGDWGFILCGEALWSEIILGCLGEDAAPSGAVDVIIWYGTQVCEAWSGWQTGTTDVCVCEGPWHNGTARTTVDDANTIQPGCVILRYRLCICPRGARDGKVRLTRLCVCVCGAVTRRYSFSLFCVGCVNSQGPSSTVCSSITPYSAGRVTREVALAPKYINTIIVFEYSCCTNATVKVTRLAPMPCRGGTEKMDGNSTYNNAHTGLVPFCHGPLYTHHTSQYLVVKGPSHKHKWVDHIVMKAAYQ